MVSYSAVCFEILAFAIFKNCMKMPIWWKKKCWKLECVEKMPAYEYGF